MGPFDHASKLKVGDIQSMQYSQDDTGPFYMSEEKRRELNFDVETEETETKKYTRSQLIDKIQSQTDLKNVRGTLVAIQGIATSHNIPIDYQRKKIREGWANEPKGMLQILWERGCIDPQKGVSDYAVNVKKDKDKNKTIEGSNLKDLVDNLQDF